MEIRGGCTANSRWGAGWGGSLVSAPDTGPPALCPWREGLPAGRNSMSFYVALASGDTELWLPEDLKQAVAWRTAAFPGGRPQQLG